MATDYRPFAYIIAANVEALGILLAGWWGGNWLNENYPMAFDWLAVTMIFGLIVVGVSWYRMFRDLSRKRDKN